MSEYLIKIIGLVLVSVLLTNLLPTGKTCILIKNIARLCVYLSILTPAFDFFISLNTKANSTFEEIFPDYFSDTVIPTDESYIKYCSEKSIEKAENSLEKIVLDDYGITVEITLQTSVDADGSKIKIEKGILDGLGVTNKELLQKICKGLQDEYSVPFEFTQGERL